MANSPDGTWLATGDNDVCPRSIINGELIRDRLSGPPTWLS